MAERVDCEGSGCLPCAVHYLVANWGMCAMCGQSMWVLDGKVIPHDRVDVWAEVEAAFRKRFGVEPETLRMDND